MAFKDRLKMLRGEKGITQEDLANAIGVPPPTIRRYESKDDGYPKNERLQAIADYFDCTVDYLLERTDIKTEVVGENAMSAQDAKLVEDFNSLDQRDQEYILDLMKRLKKEQP